MYLLAAIRCKLVPSVITVIEIFNKLKKLGILFTNLDDCIVHFLPFEGISSIAFFSSPHVIADLLVLCKHPIPSGECYSVGPWSRFLLFVMRFDVEIFKKRRPFVSVQFRPQQG